MNTQERDIANHITALQGEMPHKVKDKTVRRLSMESLGVLQMIGSPFAAAFSAALNGQQPESAQPSSLDAVLLAWVHAEDEDTVLEVALECAPGVTDPAIAAAMRFIRGWSVAEVAQVIQFALGDLTAVQAASYDMAAPNYGDTKKNG